MPTSDVRLRAISHAQLLESLGDAVVGTDADGAVVYWNAAASDLFGYSPGEALGTVATTLMVPDGARAAADTTISALGSAGSWTGEFLAQHRAGHTFWCRVSDSPMLDDDGHLAGRVGVLRDVSHEVRLRAGVAQSEQLFRQIFLESPLGLAIVEVGLDTMQVNRALAEMLGYSLSDLAHVRPGDLTHPDDVETDLGAMRLAQSGLTPGAREIRYLAKSGDVVYALSRASLVRDRRGEGMHVISMIEDVTEVRTARLRIEEQTQRLDLAMDSAGVTAWDVNLLTGELVLSDNFRRIFGVDPPRCLDEVRQYLMAEDRHVLDQLGANCPGPFEAEMRFLDAECTLRHVRAYGTSGHDADGRTVMARGILIDVSEQQAAEQHQQRAELTYRTVIETSVDAFVGVDGESRITDWNAAAEKLFGWHRDEVVGCRLEQVVIPERFRVAHLKGLHRLLESSPPTGVVMHREVLAQARDGREIPIELQITALPNDGHTTLKAFIRDLTERKEYEATLARQAVTDPLTGLPNRSVLIQRLQAALDRLRDRPGEVGVAFVDIDRFKVINDSLGHTVGDQLLIAVADRFVKILNRGETLTRFGGDEFVIVCEDWHGEASAADLAGRLHQALKADLLIGDRRLSVDVSIGVAIGHFADSVPEDLVRDADVAMYRAKRLPGSQWELFDDNLRIDAVARLELERELRVGIESGALDVHYQPVVTMNQKLVGLEALVRWRHPHRGLVRPNDFIPVAEETGLISDIGDYVIERSFSQFARWHRDFPRSSQVALAINLSGRQLVDPDLPARVGRLLNRYSIPAPQVCFEITESVLMDNTAGAVDSLAALNKLGVQLAVDDFGTGFASLLSLRRLPVQILKLDRAFVRGLGLDRRDTAIVRSGVDLAHSLGMSAIAEGVESVDQLLQLQSLGCDFAQGYLWSRPVPPRSVQSWLTTLRPRRQRS